MWSLAGLVLHGPPGAVFTVSAVQTAALVSVSTDTPGLVFLPLLVKPSIRSPDLICYKALPKQLI